MAVEIVVAGAKDHAVLRRDGMRNPLQLKNSEQQESRQASAKGVVFQALFAQRSKVKTLPVRFQFGCRHIFLLCVCAAVC
jgi:hypothetical protein